jgi:regulatory protein
MEPTPQRITAISTQVRRPDRVNVFLDGQFAFGLPATVAADHGLAVGDALDAARVEELRALDDTAKATEAAIRLLTVRPRSVKEIRDRLARKGYAEETIEVALERLRDWRYIDDDAFARYWVENRESNRPRGRRLLQQELRFKGVDRETTERALADAGIDEQAGALEIARTKMRSYRDLDEAAARRRLGAFLTRRGYGYDVIKPTLEALFGVGEEDEGPLDP